MARPPEMPSMDGANMRMAEDMPMSEEQMERTQLPPEAVAQTYAGQVKKSVLY